jgi:hypothetical protein
MTVSNPEKEGLVHQQQLVGTQQLLSDGNFLPLGRPRAEAGDGLRVARGRNV